MVYYYKINPRIPAALKDRRLRPYDINKGEECVFGILKMPKTKIHDYDEPNDPTYNLWINFNLEDFVHYWEFPNRVDAKYCYFEEVNFGALDPVDKKDVFPVRNGINDVIVENGREYKRLRLDRNYRYLTYGSSASTAFFTYLFYLAA
jgi:hypothetical protein